MTYHSHFSFQRAIYQLLAADNSLSAMVSGVFDHVPQGSIYPFITLGEAQLRDRSDLEHSGTEVLLTLRVYSREAGRKEAADIMERITTLLHNTTPEMERHEVLSLQFHQSRIDLLDDGATYRGTIIFKALLRMQA